MASGLPEYQSREQLGPGPQPGVRGIPLPGLPDVSAADKALSGFGAELTAVAQKLEQGQQHTAVSQGMERFVTGNDELKQQYVKDTDYVNAEKNYKDASAELQRSSLENISDPTLRARASLEMSRSMITVGNDVRTAQVARQADINNAANLTLRQASINEAISAPSPQERAAAIDRYTADLERLHASGWKDAKTVVSDAQSFGQSLERADVMALGQKDPAKAVEMLADPKNFSTLDPVTRQSFRAAFEEKDETNRNAMLAHLAHFAPAAALATVGLAGSPDAVRRVFNEGIVAIESAGDNSLVSNKGALGASQILPGTARDVATSLGRKDIAGLSDADLKARLLSDPALNRDLGYTYFQQLVTRYVGSIPLAAAGYNAGPGRADKWKADAEAQFGPTFTPAQLASVVDIKETKDYIGKVYAKLGASMDHEFGSPAAAVRAATTVNGVLQAEDARQKGIYSLQASTQDQTNPVNQLLKAGIDVAPQNIEAYRLAQENAAKAGDQEAAKRLRDLNLNLQIQPMIRQAWNTPPSMLDDAVKAMNARITAPGANPSIQEVQAVKAFQSVLDEQVKTRDAEPVVLGGQNGGRYYQLQPLDPKAQLDDVMLATLQARDVQARQAKQIYGGSGSPFTVQEAQGLQERYAQATPQDRTALLGTLAKGLSPDSFAAALPQVTHGTTGKSDRPGLMMAAGLFPIAPEVAASIVQGMEGTDKYLPDTGANKTSYETEKASWLPPALFTTSDRLGDKGRLGAMSDAIDARYAYLSAQANDSSKTLNPDRLRQAATDVTGGIASHNGRKVIVPTRGMSQAQFDGVIWGLKDQDLAGAQTSKGEPIDAAYLRDAGKLVARTDGLYYVQVNQDDAKPQYAGTAIGTPFLLDLRNRQPGVVVYDPTKSGMPMP